MTGKVTLTGIKPTGTPHLGNLVGAIKPALQLAQMPGCTAVYFIADYHALTTVHDDAEMQQLTREVAAAWIACGLDAERVLFYRQSDIPEIFELAWVLACFAPKGKLNRAHAYKAAVADNVESARDPDDGIHMGLFNYPVLMAADILMFDADLVPVGSDQEQHVEIARDIAERFNQAFGPTLKLPQARVDTNTAAIPGIDGRKMSKSYGNVVPLFATDAQTRKLFLKYKTDSSRPEDPKDPDGSPLFWIYKEFASPADIDLMRQRYGQGIGWGEVKEEVARVVNDYLREPRRIYADLIADPDRIDALLAAGAVRARRVARQVMDRVRHKIGLRAPA